MASLARGPGQMVASVKIDVAPAILSLECERLPAKGSDPAGGPDKEGCDLHVRYEGARPMLLEKSDQGRPILACEFDAQCLVIVPYCGTLALVGGRGRYRWSISRPEKWDGVYVPQWRALTRVLGRETSFFVPEGHTRIGSLNAGSMLVSADGDVWALDGSDKPVVSGMRATASMPVRIFTLAHF